MAAMGAAGFTDLVSLANPYIGVGQRNAAQADLQWLAMDYNNAGLGTVAVAPISTDNPDGTRTTLFAGGYGLSAAVGSADVQQNGYLADPSSYFQDPGLQPDWAPYTLPAGDGLGELAMAGVKSLFGRLFGAAVQETAAFGQSYATSAEWSNLLASRYGAENVSGGEATALRDTVYGNVLANQTALASSNFSSLGAAEETTNTVGALEDWSNVDFEARLAARDNAWETDNAINIHGNSANSPRTAYLYGLYDKETSQLLKWGITQNPATRYTKTFMEDKIIRPMTSGPRALMLQQERNLVETQPGPLNFEPWAGSQAGGQ